MTSKETEQTKPNHNLEKLSTVQLNNLNKKITLSELKSAMSRIPILDTTTQLGEDVSFVGGESPSDYLQTLYDKQRLMQVHMPRKFSNGRATNIPTEDWSREYKKLQHRINFVEKQVATGLDFPEITPNNRMPAEAEPTIQQIQVNQTNSKSAWGEMHTVPFEPESTE